MESLLNECRQSGVVLSIDATGGLSYRGPREALGQLLPAIRQHKTSLLALLIGRQDATGKINRLAETLATELKTTAEHCLSLLDDGDRRLIESGDLPTLKAWKGFAALSVEPAPPQTPNDGDPLTVTGWTPNGRPITVKADSPGHTEYIGRMNQSPEQRGQTHD